MIVLNPLKAKKKHTANGVALSSLFEIMLIFAIRDRTDEVLLRNTSRGCRVIHTSGDTTYDVVPMPKHLTGRAINYYRDIFGVRFPATQRKVELTLSGKSSVVIHFEILGASPIGQARFTFTENEIADEECREFVAQYFKAVRNETPFLTKFWHDIKNWLWPVKFEFIN